MCFQRLLFCRVMFLTFLQFFLRALERLLSGVLYASLQQQRPSKIYGRCLPSLVWQLQFRWYMSVCLTASPQCPESPSWLGFYASRREKMQPLLFLCVCVCVKESLDWWWMSFLLLSIKEGNDIKTFHSVQIFWKQFSPSFSLTFINSPCHIGNINVFAL